MATKKAEKFWIIWCPTSDKPPRVRYESEAKAEEVATNMVKKYHAQFIVMESRNGLQVGPPEKLAFTNKPKKSKTTPLQKQLAKSTSLPIQRSYDGWKAHGFHVRRGERANGYVNGVAMFTAKQVEQTDNLNWDGYGSEDPL